jgi:hypothetical protein
VLLSAALGVLPPLRPLCALSALSGCSPAHPSNIAIAPPLFGSAERAGHSGRISPCKVPVLCYSACSPGAPLIKGHKKSAVTPHPHSPGPWPTAPSVDSLHVRYTYQRPSVVDILRHAESDMRPSALDVVRELTPDLWTFQVGFCCTWCLYNPHMQVLRDRLIKLAGADVVSQRQPMHV